MQPTIGDTIGSIRRSRAMTQEELAEASGVSVETIRKLEQNGRTSARISTLHKLARALRVKTSALFGTSAQPVVSGDGSSPVPLIGLRAALFPARGIAGVLEVPGDVPVSELSRVEADVHAVDLAYHASDYVTVVAVLPDLVARARVAAESAGGEQAAALLAQVYLTAGAVLIQLRRLDLAHRALDLSMDAANRASSEVVAGFSVVTLCWLLMRQSRLDEAERLAVVTADAVEPSFAKAVPEHLATWGWLMLRLAAAAARNNRDDVANDALDAAAAAATRICGASSRMFVAGPATIGSFCPATVAMKRVETAVVVGDTSRALSLAEQVPPSDRPSANNRNRYLLDVAHAQVDHRRYADATATLTKVRADAPGWLRQQRYARDIVSNLATARRRALTNELLVLAEAVGLNV